VSKPIVDDLDRRILQQLQIDGRMPFTRIAEELGVSDATVRARVARLTRSRMVKFVADVDAGDLGLVEVYLGLKVQGPELEGVVDALAATPEIPYVALCTGAHDILCELVCLDNDELLRSIMDVRAIPGVSHVEAITVLKIRKDDWRYTALAQESRT
jgi:Lrp/AsnC family transcriptional regulator, regulator for asnA, asnC and gidA